MKLKAADLQDRSALRLLRLLPRRIDGWSLTSFEQRLVKTGGRLVKHARYYWLLWSKGISRAGVLAAC